MVSYIFSCNSRMIRCMFCMVNVINLLHSALKMKLQKNINCRFFNILYTYSVRDIEVKAL